MKILNAVLIALGLFGILRFPILSIAKNAWAKHDLLTKRKRGFWIAVIEQAASVMLTAGSTFVILAAILLFINLQGGASVEKMNHALDRLEALRQPLKLARDIWGGWLLFFSLVIFVYLWFRTGKKHFVEKLAAQVRERYKELQQVLEERPEDWEKLELTPAMKALLGQLQRMGNELESLRSEDPHYAFRLAKLAESRDRLANMLVQLDFERRIEIPWDLDVPTAETRWGDFKNALLSKGFINDMKGFGKFFKYGVLVLTFAGLVGIQSSSLTGIVETKIAKLDDLAVSKSTEESAKKRKNAEQLTHSEEPSKQLQVSPTPQQQTALRAFSRQAVHDFARNPVWAEVPRRAAAASEQARQDLVRLAVLENVNPARTPPQDEYVTQEAAFQVYSDEAARPDRTSAAERAVYQDITGHPTVNRRTFWAAAEDWYVHKRASYHDPVSTEELQASFVENAFASFVPSAESHEFTTQFGELLKEGLQASGKNAFETFRNIVAFRTLNGDGPEEILSALGKRDPHIAYMTRAASKSVKAKLSIFNERVKTESDFVNIAEQRVARTDTQPEDNSGALEVLKSLPEEIRRGREVEFADLLSGYTSEFPTRATPVSTFSREKVLASWGISNTNDAAVRLSRSTDFERLQSYSRVGGILFGRRPDRGTLDVPGFWWEKKNDTLSLYLQKRDLGAPIAAGTYEPYLIWQALVYAADKRPTVVTLLLTPGIGRKQVMVHPAFRDTALGCRLIAADQWIFHYSDPDPSNPNSSEVRRMINRYSIESGLYVRAWEALHDPDKKGAVASERLRPMLESFEFSSIETAQDIQPDLLRLAIRCATTQGNTFDDCIRRGADGTHWRASLPGKKPRFAFASQIRESQYNVDDSLAFLQASQATSTSAPPLEMTVQMTIDDNSHWQFPGFDPKTVLVPLEKEKSQNLQEMQQLAALQRLFRVAFNGGFGPAFPIEKLIELSSLARNMDNSEKKATPRWLKDRGDDKPIEKGLAEDMRQYLNGHGAGVTETLERATVNKVRPLLQVCSDTLSMNNVEAIPTETLDSRCQWREMQAPVLEDCRAAKRAEKNLYTVEACRVFALARYGESTVSPLHKLRLSLHADVVDRAENLACPGVP